MNKSAAKGFPAGQDLPDPDGVPMDNELHPEQSRKYVIDPLRRWLSECGISARAGEAQLELELLREEPRRLKES